LYFCLYGLTNVFFLHTTFSKTLIALILTALFLIILHATLHLHIQLYLWAKFGIKTTKAEAKYLEPLLGGFNGVWYPLNELWDVPREKRKEVLFTLASRLLGHSYHEKE
jgi:hypothetical protein